MALAPPPLEPSVDADKLSYEIFSILESKFLFGYDDPNLLLSSSTSPPAASAPRPAGRVRILSIDGCGRPSDALLAAFSLARLESSLRRRSCDPSARVADFFDVAAGSGAGGVLAAMLFTRGPDGRPLYAADEALRFLLAQTGRSSSGHFAPARRGLLGWLLRRRPGAVLRRVFGDATLRDTVKPVLAPCYDLATGAPFLFSRADAVEADGYDFRIREVCAATCADPALGAAPVEMRSTDGRTWIAAVGGGVTMANPAAAAITHVLNNKREFPFAAGVEDLMVLSLGSTSGGSSGADGRRRHVPSAAELVRIAGDGVADMVRTLPLFFLNATTLLSSLEETLSQKNVESSLFRGKKISDQSNGEKIEWFASELAKEDERRKKSRIPVVVLKQVVSPRTSSTAASIVIDGDREKT
ncbi:hypothetical protein BHM03_00011158 [Ensete ventricosum]|uniref:Patatin n=1 Tax=Ensete ventricosum TaxID=4639 RepID=A0A445MD40_ENSVE|nr:hypothetical protein BHM03_00011158 [Ensete ventricosum]